MNSSMLSGYLKDHFLETALALLAAQFSLSEGLAVVIDCATVDAETRGDHSCENVGVGAKEGPHAAKLESCAD
jgi:hypothetical protein